MSPLFESEISRSVLQIPIEYRKYRRLAVDLINKSSKEMAKFPVHTREQTIGVSLLDVDELVLKRYFKERIRSTLTPYLISNISFFMNKKRNLPFYVRPKFINNLFNNDIYLSKYFNPNYTKNLSILSRLYSLELLIHKYNLNLD